MYTLPKNDFVWNWGEVSPRASGAAMPDIEISGGEGGFRCDLDGAAFSPSSSLTPTEISEFEMELNRGSTSSMR